MALSVKGARTIGATRETVWAALHDVDFLKLCVPGCQELQQGIGETFHLSVLVRLKLVQVEFRGEIEVRESHFPSSYVMTGRGSGGLAGFAQGIARISLSEVPSGCRLAYTLKTVQDGPLAILGALFLTGIAQTLADRFVATLAVLVEARTRDEPRLTVQAAVICDRTMQSRFGGGMPDLLAVEARGS